MFLFLNLLALVGGVASQCFQPDHTNLDFLCPINYNEIGGFQLTVSPLKEVQIQCDHLSNFDTIPLPEMEMHRINSLQFRFCPLPHFTHFLNHFQTKEVTVVEIEYGNCGNQSLRKEIFSDLHPLKFLKISRTQFVQIEDDFLANTPNLIAFELKNCNLKQLKASFFEKLRFLEWLDLSENQLVEIPEDAFVFLESLEFLRLWGNQITHLYDSSFAGLKNLKFLDLSVNNLTTLPSLDLKNLVNLSLGSNSLTALSGDVFQKSVKLQSLVLNDNRDLQLDEMGFALLQEIDLSNCNLVQLPTLSYCQDLKIIYLADNQLKMLPNRTFQNLHYLEKLDLSGNRLEELDGLFGNLRKLKTLNLQRNLIRAITHQTFSDLIRLEELDLSQNRIQLIHPDAFFHNEKLRVFDLSQNLYAGRDCILKDLLFLEEVYVRENYLSQIEHLLVLYNKATLNILDLRKNLISEISLLHLQALSEVEIYLQYNEITTVSFADLHLISGPHRTILHLSHNPIRCDCHNFDLFRYFNANLSHTISEMFEIRKDASCATPTTLHGELLSKLPLEASVCLLEKSDCPKMCSCSWRPFDSFLLVNCSNANLTLLPQLNLSNSTQIELNLQNNHLTFINLTELANITRVYAAGNQIREVFGLPQRLEVLELDNNNLSSLSDFNFINFANLKRLTLGHNSWSCDCKTLPFSSFLRQHIKQIDFQNISCLGTNQRIVDLDATTLCYDFLYLYVFLTMLILLTTTILFYRFQEEIKVFLFARNLCLCWLSEEDLDKTKIYDAFISYSHRDEEFVTHLVQHLEEAVEEYKLCLHFRDWFPGELITTHIVNSVAQSKRTIVILSENFLQSVWAKAEFQKAHAEAMADGRARVIVVIYGSFDFDAIDDAELRAYLKTNTYLRWNDQFFWEKLKYALPHRKRQKIVV